MPAGDLMSDHTDIAWCDATWNPIIGCSRVSEGCQRCYAERLAGRFVHGPVFGGRAMQGPYHGLVRITSDGPRWTGEVRLVETALDAPLRWRRPRRIFVNSMSDLFHPRVRPEWIDRIMEVIAATPRHTYLALTKRPELIEEKIAGSRAVLGRPVANLWLGASVEDQATADKRLPHLVSLAAEGWSTFVSVEPLLGAVDLRTYLPQVVDNDLVSVGLDWVVIGGESGPGARPCAIAWIRALVAECRTAAVPCFVKQLGRQPALETTWCPELGVAGAWPVGTRCRGGIACLRDPKGADPDEWPEDLRVREIP